ncbi:hypothetical protein MGG_16584 [Pyricularia oryzae 70-15]|uniref:Aminoglycoside phosphotransferase domain-containing protein n=1 Tax=Pyricularia oryzae (strain 70-15 / ATCC MYA-4617 / FGSC 8958) TaxID=242507 RepID=G4N5G0_PYRO7|nr:uncharacterized protein MGG_16584 [Pyricularia oryzae 70-15]EHA51360.1 hypothetical protein MGG_16584 [Pyricularia oryzae 70-15]
MPGATDSLNDAICRFLEVGTSSCRTECDEYACQNCGGERKPNYHQGIRSYIVIAGPSSNKIVQFREKTALLDMRSLAPAKEIHLDLVSSCSELGWIGETKGQQLAVEQHMRTVTSLARFFAQSWLKGMPKDPNLIDVRAVSAECHARLEYLAGGLPERFIPIITQVQATLPALLDGTCPVVLTHSDLNQMNILVDPVKGNITAVVDWAGTSCLPFGFTLYALEHALGRYCTPFHADFTGMLGLASSSSHVKICLRV